MKISKAIELVDKLRPNPFDEENKIRWLSELDGKISLEVLRKDDFPGYNYSGDMEKELIAEDEYSNIYIYYLCAMIDFFSRDYGDYNNSMILFNSDFEKYAKAVKNGTLKKSGKTDGEYYKNIF